MRSMFSPRSCLRWPYEHLRQTSWRPQVHAPGQGKENRVPPLKEFFKVNADASFDEDNLQGTTGAVIRDSKRRFIAARTSKIVDAYDVLSAEAMPLRGGVLLADSMGCSRLSSISSVVIDAMKDKMHATGNATAFFSDCYFPSRDLAKVSFEHVSHEANSIAHE